MWHTINCATPKSEISAIWKSSSKQITPISSYQNGVCNTPTQPLKVTMHSHDVKEAIKEGDTPAHFKYAKRSMDRRIGYIVIAFIGALLFYVAIGYHGWFFCRNSILSEQCLQGDTYVITGSLLITAAFLITCATVFLIIEYSMDARWANITAAVLIVLSAILAMAGVFYFYRSYSFWSPSIATMAMSFIIVLAPLVIMDAFSEWINQRFFQICFNLSNSTVLLLYFVTPKYILQIQIKSSYLSKSKIKKLTKHRDGNAVNLLWWWEILQSNVHQLH